MMCILYLAERAAPYVAPLWPAGHLPLKGGDWLSSRLSPIANAAKEAVRLKRLIPSLEGEMAALRQKLRRPEGGAKERWPSGVCK
jgi:hypothetical protein